MGRAWTDADQEQWQHAENHAGPTHSETDVPSDPLLRDVVVGCIVHLVAVALYRLRLAAPSARILSQEIKAATDARTFWEWLAEPMVDLPEQFEATVEIDR